MKRILIEWCLILLAGLAIGISILWGVSRFLDRSSHQLRFATSGLVQDDIHLLVSDGALTICDQFGVDASDKVHPLVFKAHWLVRSDILRGDRARHLTIPGIELHYYRHPPDGSVIWSLRFTLLIPAFLLFLISLLLHRNLKRWLRAKALVPPQFQSLEAAILPSPVNGR